MVEFGGWEMPVYYVGINEEHRAVRARAGIFDVSHMCRVEVTGSGAQNLLRRALAGDVDRLEEGQAQYTFLCNEKGGIIDDLIVYRLPEGRWLLVVNAGHVAEDVAALKALKVRGATITDTSAATGMIALQGPVALELLADIWQKKAPAPDTIPAFHVVERTVAGIPCIVARTGYTGEPGVELICAADRAGDLWDAILARREHGVVPSGLGARDTLRLEMGYPLHGHELSREITPVQARLGWAVGWDKPAFPGRAALVAEKASGPRRVLRGLLAEGRGIPRAELAVMRDGRQIGVTTSGTFSPTLRMGIALALLEPSVQEDRKSTR